VHIDTPALFDDASIDDDFSPGLEGLCEVVRTASDPLALATLAELLEHPHPSIRSAAAEALARLSPKDLDLRRQLSPRAAARVRTAMGWTKSRPTRKARGALAASRDQGDEEESDE
jgi:hypothetical protein